MCPTAQLLFDNYASDTMTFFEATDLLVTFVGQHGPFEEERKYAEQARQKCNAAHQALEQHWARHRCRDI